MEDQERARLIDQIVFWQCRARGYQNAVADLFRELRRGTRVEVALEGLESYQLVCLKLLEDFEKRMEPKSAPR